MLACARWAGIQLKIIWLFENCGSNVSKGDSEHKITVIFEAAWKACHLCWAAQYILYTTAGTLLLTLVERGKREDLVVVVVVREQETLLLDAIEWQVYILLGKRYRHSYTAWLDQWWSLKVTHPTRLTGPLTHTYRVTPGQLFAGAGVAHRDGLLSFIGSNPFLPPVSNDIVTIPIPTLPTSLPH